MRMDTGTFNTTFSIGIGSDHHGVAIRSKLAEVLRQEGFTVEEFGPPLTNIHPTDYPDIAKEVASRVGSGELARGILICGTGIGMCIAANKFANIRAATITDTFTAELSRRHNDLNILCLSGELLDEETITRIIFIWLNTSFDGGRHEIRLEKLNKVEHQVGLQ
ncbi:MAG: ribose 5-phosphate isomerase B [Planctomycetaceae bacterium]|nr:ribose 5-phosphate isomerase B [Planctomycetaceae bacterium]